MLWIRMSTNETIETVKLIIILVRNVTGSVDINLCGDK